MKVPRACALLSGFVLSLTILPADAATFDWSATAVGPASSGFFPFTGSGTPTATMGSGGDLVTNITRSFASDGSPPVRITSDGSPPVTDAVAGVGPLNASPTFMTNSLVFPIGTDFTGPPVAGSGVTYASVANLDMHGLALAAGGGFGVGLFNLTPTPPVNGGQGGNNQGENNNGQGNNNQNANLAAADPAAPDPPVLTPLPAALSLFAIGLGGFGLLGLLGWRRKPKASLLG